MQTSGNEVVQFDQIIQLVGSYVIKLFGPLTILIIGWLVALIVSSVVREVLRRTSLDNRLARWIFGEEEAQTVQIEKLIAKGAYYLIMLFVLIGFFQTLGLSIVTEPLNRFLGEIFQFAPRIFSAILLLAVAWILANVLKRVMYRVLDATNVDKRLRAQAGLEDKGRPSIAKTVSDAVFWVVILLFLPAVLNVLALESLFRPLEAMFSQFLGFLPNLFGAALILAAGWFVARIAQRIVTNLLGASGLDQLSERARLSTALGTQKLSSLLGLVVYGLLLIPVVIAALNAMQLEAITQPASEMLGLFLGAIPSIVAAALLITIAYMAGRLLAGFITNLLTGLGFNAIVARAGYSGARAEGPWTPAAVAGSLVLVVTMLFASIEALRLLDFAAVSEMLRQFTVFGGRVLLGLLIFAIGLYLSGLAARAVTASGTAQAGLLAVAAQISVVVLAGAMALRQMGLANEIIDLAFGLLLGAITVAIALSFGLGGRDVAKQELEEWVRNVKARRSPAQPES